MAEQNRTKVIILTGSYRIKGYIDLVPGARVTDYMTEAKNFIAVTDAEVWEAGGAPRAGRPVPECLPRPHPGHHARRLTIINKRGRIYFPDSR